MATLLDKSWTREALLKHVGSIDQIAAIRISELSDGPGRGVRTAEFKTGSGFSFTVLIDRGLDVHDADFKGISLAYRSPGGIRHPSYYEASGMGWLRNFHGGLLNTCGLTNVGVPGRDHYGEYGLHGRASNLPAQIHGYGGTWLGDEYELWLDASIRETSFFGFDLQLTRRISTRMGKSYIKIADRIQNLADRNCPLMLLYHCNFGFPLVSPGARLALNHKSMQPRDEMAKQGIENHDQIEEPQSGYQEQVFFHQLQADDLGFAAGAIFNESLGLSGYVTFRKKELPNFIQWKQMGVKEYAMGLEPANCLVLGREAENQSGTLRTLKSGETEETILFLGVEPDKNLIENIERRETVIPEQDP